MSPSPELSQPIVFDPAKHLPLLPAFVHLHKTCVESPPYPVLTFLPPFPPEKISKVESWWQDRFSEVKSATRHIVFVMLQPKEGEKAQVAGVCMLSTPTCETGPHRGFVEKFMVDPELRGKGVGTGIMRATEKVAEEMGAWLLCGRIPEYDVWSQTGELKTEVFFYKKLVGAEKKGSREAAGSSN
ncbi:putative acyl- n-acyltransferase protein [Botrytis cinerea BcDW1]|uniref:Putative acyl-n-acyltransferase protein n=1 Tax=Botryotinia fuckeliana (strain BcDW1) TaxID=1290391 RepID=M7TIX2_BOTF1|nr:putative acyl- n-acyltransferase protein [Botrytis cinerea BcDW1]